MPQLIVIDVTRTGPNCTAGYRQAWKRGAAILEITRRGRWVRARLDLAPTSFSIAGLGRYHGERLRNICFQRRWAKPEDLSYVGKTLIEITVLTSATDYVVAAIKRFVSTPSYFRKR